MRYAAILVACLALLATWGAPRAPESSGALQTVELNTRAFGCDGVSRELDTGLHQVRVRKVYIWLGAFDYTNADIVFSLEHIGADGKYQSIAKGGWDHYATPTGIANQTLVFDYAPDWVRVAADESLKLYAQCNPMDEPSRAKKAHVIALVYYLR